MRLYKFLFVAPWILAGVVSAAAPAPASFDHKGAQPGEQLPDLPLRSLDNEPVTLDSQLNFAVTLLVTSSFTCPKSRENFPSLEMLRAKYKKRLNIVILYVIEAHPAGDPSPYRNGKEDVTPQNRRDGILRRQPTKIEKRLALANEFSEHFHTTIPMLVDNMNNFGWKSVGAGPNMAILLSPRGHVLARQGWFDAKTLVPEIDKALIVKPRRKDPYDTDADRQLAATLKKANIDIFEFRTLASDDHLPQLKAALKANPALTHFVCEYMGKGDMGGRTLLQYAAELNQPMAAKILLDHGADPEQFTMHRASAVHLAAISGNDAVLKLLLARTKNVDARQGMGPTALQEALFHQARSSAALLKRAGAKENFFTHVARGDVADVAAAIANDPSVAGRPDGLSRSPLAYAAASGQTAVAKMLVEAGAPINIPGQSVQSLPLPLAIIHHHADMIAWLIEGGADLSVADYYTGDPLHLAAKLGDVATVKLLIKAHADIHQLNALGYNPLHEAASAGKADAISALLDAGLDVNGQTGVENLPCGPMEPESQLATPLILAAQSGSAGTVKTLLARGADVSLTDVEYQGPLHAAVNAYGAKPEEINAVIELLLAAKAPINAEDMNGKTALDLARERKLPAVARFLLDHHAKPGSGTVRSKKKLPAGMHSRSIFAQ